MPSKPPDHRSWLDLTLNEGIDDHWIKANPTAVSAARAELQQMRECIEKLPRCKDGVPIYPGMKVWALVGRAIYESHAMPRLPMQSMNVSLIDVGMNAPDWECYSTYKLAKAAMAQLSTKESSDAK